MKPYIHARLTVKKWGGKPEDYLPIHDFIDETKAHHADMRHRAMLHNSWGIYLCERIFGHNITNSDGRLVSVRDVAEQHVIEDMGRIPSITDYLVGMPMYHWIGGPKQRRTTIKEKPHELNSRTTEDPGSNETAVTTTVERASSTIVD